MTVPAERIRVLRDVPVRADRAFVVHWMTTSRRDRYNPALERAGQLARELGKPVLVLEPLRCDYPFASDRLHAFLLQGTADLARRLAGRALHYPYIEPRPGEGRGLLAEVARHACAVVADDHPGSFFPRMLEAAAKQVDVRLEAVEKELILKALEMSGWNQTHAAKYLDLSRKTLIYRMEKHGIRRNSPDSGADSLPWGNAVLGSMSSIKSMCRAREDPDKPTEAVL